MDGLLKLLFLGNTLDVRKLRQTYDELEAHVRGLQALEVPTESYGSFLVPLLMTKIPEDIRLLVGPEMKDGDWNLTQILQLLRSEVENRERCGGLQALVRKREFIQSRRLKIETAEIRTNKCVSIVFRKPAFKYNTLHILQATAPNSKLSCGD